MMKNYLRNKDSYIDLFLVGCPSWLANIDRPKSGLRQIEA